jgi:hypothetical protein
MSHTHPVESTSIADAIATKTTESAQFEEDVLAVWFNRKDYRRLASSAFASAGRLTQRTGRSDGRSTPGFFDGFAQPLHTMIEAPEAIRSQSLF